MNLELRPPTPEEAHLVVGFIQELAEYEKLAHECVITEDDVREALFRDKPYADCRLAILDGKAVGFCLFFYNFSTFLGKPGLYLEDLYVKPEYRNAGIGKRILSHLAQVAIEKDCGRFEWSVLDWNEPSIAFYRKIGAVPMDEWTVQRVTGDALLALANSFK